LLLAADSSPGTQEFQHRLQFSGENTAQENGAMPRISDGSFTHAAGS
jgi:hypothetical protein